jgi:hypothetical protein
MLQSDELRREQLRAELAEGSKAHKRYQKIGVVVFAFLAIGLFHFVGSCSQASVMEAREDDAVTEFTRALKNLGSSSPGEFGMASKQFDDVINVKKSYDPYVYKAMIQILSYNWYKTHKKPADDNLLTQADGFLGEAVKLNAKGPEVHYYLAALASLKDDTTKCKSELEECLKLSEALEAGPKAQWKEKVEHSKANLAKTPPDAFDFNPPLVMVPKISIIK